MIRELARVRSHIAALQELQAGTVKRLLLSDRNREFRRAGAAQVPRAISKRALQRHDEQHGRNNRGLDKRFSRDRPCRQSSRARADREQRGVSRLDCRGDQAPDHPLAGRPTLRLSELAEFSLTLTERSFGLRQRIDQVFERHRFDPTVFCVTNSLSLMKEIARFNRQCALLPRFAIENEVAAGLLVAVPVEEFATEQLVFCICARNGRPMSPAAKVFADAIVEFCQRYR